MHPLPDARFVSTAHPGAERHDADENALDPALRRQRLAVVLALVAALACAALIGAWENSPSRAGEPARFASHRSAFVQSGGSLADTLPGVPDAARALARQAPSAEVATATTF